MKISYLLQQPFFACDDVIQALIFNSQAFTSVLQILCLTGQLIMMKHQTITSIVNEARSNGNITETYLCDRYELGDLPGLWLFHLQPVSADNLQKGMSGLMWHPKYWEEQVIQLESGPQHETHATTDTFWDNASIQTDVCMAAIKR
ncbi:unnamed protein product, partial [Rhizoctonia solani]